MPRAALLLVLPLLAGATAPPRERPNERPNERIVTGDGVERVTVNGVEGHMRIDPGAAAMPLIDREWANGAGLKAGMFGFQFGIGPEKVNGATAVGRINYGGGAVKQRIGFTARRFTAAAQGVAGPGSVPEPVVRFVLQPARPGERVTSFRMIDQGGIMGGWAERFAVIEVGGQPMRLRFDPHHPHTLATAGAGVRLAAAYDGHVEGEPVREEIAFGIERPVRRLVLARPLAIGPVAIDRLGVRTADHGNAATIPDAAAVPADPDEIVVTAKGGKHDWRRDRLALGADVLARCSSIVFDKPARVVRLSCV